MSGDLTGKFNYSSLIKTLKDNGVQAATRAAKRVGRDNDIDNIKDIDGTQEITIAQSIFNNVRPIDATNPFEVQNQAQIFPFDTSYTEKLHAGKIMSDGDSLMNFPEIYNDDEYEVADYDDYYAFGNSNETLNEAPLYSPIDEIDGIKKELLPYTPDMDEEITKTDLPYIPNETENVSANLYGFEFDKDASDYTNDAEKASSLYAPPVSKKKDPETSDAVKGDENLDAIKEEDLEADMQNDSFNAK